MLKRWLSNLCVTASLKRLHASDFCYLDVVPTTSKEEWEDFLKRPAVQAWLEFENKSVVEKAILKFIEEKGHFPIDTTAQDLAAYISETEENDSQDSANGEIDEMGHQDDGIPQELTRSTYQSPNCNEEGVKPVFKSE